MMHPCKKPVMDPWKTRAQQSVARVATGRSSSLLLVGQFLGQGCGEGVMGVPLERTGKIDTLEIRQC